MCCTGTKKLNNCIETAVFRGLAFSMTVTIKEKVCWKHTQMLGSKIKIILNPLTPKSD